jgi:hypothetical protein
MRYVDGAVVTINKSWETTDLTDEADCKMQEKVMRIILSVIGFVRHDKVNFFLI